MTSIRTLALAMTALALATSPLAAQGKGKGDKGHDGHKGKGKHDRVVVTSPGTVVIDRDGRTYGTARKTPPGLAKKPGGMPPGQYKKRYSTDRGAVVLRDVFSRNGYTVVRTATSGDARYVYFRGSDGIVQRAIVNPGSERLQFNNVPAAILTAVLSQLY